VFCFDIGMNTEEAIFKQLLEIHAGTSEILKIGRGPSQISFPSFPFGINLSHLTCLDLPHNALRNLNFLKHLPALNSLSLTGEAECTL